MVRDPAWECLSAGLCPVFGPEHRQIFMVGCDRPIMEVYLKVPLGDSTLL
ncbi:MAG: hypothetical protein V1792_09185 [Pseudomonadota bacterium]